MSQIFLFFLFFFFSVPIKTSDSILTENWNFIKEEEGMKLYSRSVAGQPEKEVRVVFQVETNLQKAKQFLFDPEHIVYWLSGCSTSNSEGAKENIKYYYATFDAPWPISDRDDCGFMKLEFSNPSAFRITFESIPKLKPVNKDFVRIPYSKGSFHLYSNGDYQLQAEYILLVDRGGHLPDSVHDYLETSSPMKTAKLLKATLENLM